MTTAEQPLTKIPMQMRNAILAMVVGLIGTVDATAADWPMQRKDYSRSGVTEETLNSEQLREAWVYRSAYPPNQAWPGPARWDAYGKIPDLRSLRNYDPVFQVSAVGDAVYFGSSADDTLYCLDAATGKERWAFTTQGPIRIAPTVQEGKIFFGSDDGFAYCLRADDGKLVWKFAPDSDRSLVLHNGRLISFWPIRTGIVVMDGTAYFAASMLPWKKTYLCAVDAASGKAEGAGRFVREFGSQTLEAPMVASARHLIIPQGRIAPLAFERTTGKQLALLQGIGSFLALSDDGQLFQGPGNRKGDIIANVPESKGKPVSFQRGNSVVVKNKTAWVLDDHAVSAIERDKRAVQWRTIVPHASELLLAGDLLYIGSRDEICALESTTGKKIWSHPVHGRAFGLAVANQRLLVSTDEGHIYCFQADPKHRNKPQQAATVSIPRAASFDDAPALALKAGPTVRFLGNDSAELLWTSLTPTPSIVEFGETTVEAIREEKPTAQHRIVLKNLRRDRIYRYRIVETVDKKEHATSVFDLDTAGNFHVPDVIGNWIRKETAATADFAQRLMSDMPDQQGIAVLVGADAELAWQLSRRSLLKIVLLEKDANLVAKWRTELRQAGVHGGRVTVFHWEDYEKAPLPSCFANLVLLNSASVSDQTANSWVKPGSGVLIKTTSVSKPWEKVQRPPLPGVGEWTHMFGKADNTAFAGETLQGRANTADLELQWFGLPGPRFNVDRNPRKPGPLAINGRLFVQGMGRVAALDAYNGSILWSVEIPRLQRYNILRDGSNWCADADSVYLVYDQQCLVLDARAGIGKAKTIDLREILPGAHQGNHEWGYIAKVGQRLLGSTVEKESAYKEFWGNKNWYDEKAGVNNRIVCADRFFALDAKGSKPSWIYTGGAILHPTISVADGKAYFVESRNPALKKKSGRLGNEVFKDMRLVALDLETGKEEWSQAIHPLPGIASFSMAISDGKIVIVSSETGKFGIYAYDAKNGSPLWDKTAKWEADHHGKHLSRPAIVGDKLIVRPYVIKLSTGETISQAFPKGHTCASYCATDQTLIFRAGEITMWNLETKQESRWPRLRTDCLLSIIAAQGMVLAPEGGGGCSCGVWLEISAGFLPVTRK